MIFFLPDERPLRKTRERRTPPQRVARARWHAHRRLLHPAAHPQIPHSAAGRGRARGSVVILSTTTTKNNILGIRSVGGRTSATLRGSARYAFGEHRQDGWVHPGHMYAQRHGHRGRKCSRTTEGIGEIISFFLLKWMNESKNSSCPIPKSWKRWYTKKPWNSGPTYVWRPTRQLRSLDGAIQSTKGAANQENSPHHHLLRRLANAALQASPTRVSKIKA